MRSTLLNFGTLIIASAIFVEPAPAADSPAARAPADEPMKAAADYSKSHTGQTMLVMFDGKVIFEQYDNGGAVEQPQNPASGAKSFIGAAALAAVQDGLIKLDNRA